MGTIELLEARNLPASLPVGFVEQTVVAGLNRATAMTVLPDGRWLVTEQAGRLRVVKDGALLSSPALTLGVDDISERGLLGVVADPSFNTNHYIYVYHTVPGTPAVNRVSRFTLSGDTVAGGSQYTVLTLDPLSSAGNHNSGALHFGADGKLYVAVGDNANPLNAPLLSSLHGKMLRLNPDGTIPADNPFYSSLTGNYRAIWARGLRNPFTFAFHPLTGRMHINDVGLKSFEEINVGRAGADYGWPGSEGETSNPSYDSPLFAYGREVGQAITAGAFYAGGAAQFPGSYADDYFFGDYVAGFIKVLDSATHQPYDFAAGIDRPTDLDLLPDGSLLYLSYGGTIHRIHYAPQTPVSITDEPDDVTVAAGANTTFYVEATGAQPLQYQWYQDETPIDGATGTSYTVNAAQVSQSGATFWARVSNINGSIDSRRAVLTVTSQNAAPMPVITAPSGSFFSAGETITFAGRAADATGNAIPASGLDWKIEYITGSVVRPFLEFADVAGRFFTVPTVTPYTQPDVKYRITLIATDSTGAQASVSRDLSPRLSQLNLSTSRAGIPVLVDGLPIASPANITSVEGLQRTIEAPISYVVGGVAYAFQKWSDNGPRIRTINTPVNDLTLLATYVSSTGTAQLSGYVVNDLNKSGTWSSGEYGIANRTVYLDANNNAALDTGEQTRATASNGKYIFTGLPAGPYVVRQVLPTGWTQTRPGAGAAFVGTLTSGQIRSGLDFCVVNSGFTTPPPQPPPPPPPPPPTGGGTAQFSGYVVNDTNKSGTWNSGEFGISGRTVWIDLDNDARLDAGEQTRTTASNGKYIFSNLVAGTYYVRELIPAGWTQSRPASSAAFKITLSAGQIKSGYDFTVYKNS